MSIPTDHRLILTSPIKLSTEERRSLASAGAAVQGRRSPCRAGQVRGPQGTENAIFAPLYTKQDHFTKTGSGQTQQKLRKRGAFFAQGLADGLGQAE